MKLRYLFAFHFAAAGMMIFLIAALVGDAVGRMEVYAPAGLAGLLLAAYGVIFGIVLIVLEAWTGGGGEEQDPEVA